ATVELLSEYLKSGGRMIGVRPDSIRINGRDSELLIEWENQYPRQLTWTGDAQLPRTIASLVPPRLTVIGNCRGCHHLRKVAEGRETWLLVNSSPEKRIFSIPNWNHPQATEVSIDSGEVHDLPINADRSLELAMEPFSARIVTQSIAPSGQPGKTDSAATKGGKAKRLQPHSIRATSPQVLVLDFCELRIGGESLGSWETRHANGLLWKRCGLSPEGWSRTVQYQQKVLERAARHPANAHFETAYSFAIADGVDRTDFELAIEHAQRWEIEVNGQTVDTSHSSPWFDPSIQKLRVDQFLRAGANSLRLQRSSFDPRVEIASAYLVGEFSLNPQAQGFMIEAPKALKLGAWTDQGLHFYDREVEYRFKLERPGVLVVKPEDWSGSWLTAEADGERRQVYPGKALELELTTAGEVKLTVTGLPWNLFGPWHCRPQTISKFTNPSCWNASEAAIRPQAGASYELLKLGLLEAPEFYG
ncbi:MAG: hypothetical protein JJU20_10730, partial [Opitutales bacterium]|nr:hypothetical protein [Opitutales bacterium]